jgi:hypothetical protein
MRKFIQFTDRVELTLHNGQNLTIYFTPLSGTVYYRFKIGSPTRIKHPGILLGADISGKLWFMHNHYETGRPSIVPENDFTKGQPIYPWEVVPVNQPAEIINKGLRQVMDGHPYTPIEYNCQSFVSDATHNQRISETVQAWVGGIIVTTLAFIGLKALKNNK